MCSPHSADCQLKVCVRVCVYCVEEECGLRRVDGCVCAGREGRGAMTYGGETCYCRNRVVLVLA